MKLRSLRPLEGNYGSVRRNQVFDATDHVARRLINKGLAVPTEMDIPADIGTLSVEVAEEATRRPPEPPRPPSPPAPPQRGGQTGEEERPSSSEEAPPRQKRRYRRSKDAASS
jgi:hypothetical protein